MTMRTCAELAQEFGLHPETIRRLAADEVLPHTRTSGRHLRFDDDARTVLARRYVIKQVVTKAKR